MTKFADFKEEDIIKWEDIDYIKWDRIKEVLWEQEYSQFSDWMSWQSSHTNWAYASDVENYFIRRDRWQLDCLPHLF